MESWWTGQEEGFYLFQDQVQVEPTTCTETMTRSSERIITRQNSRRLLTVVLAGLIELVELAESAGLGWESWGRVG